jgi:trypsin-like peptidase
MSNLIKLDEWGHPHSRSIFPFLAIKDGFLYPIGTSFCISKLGIILTAEHNFRDALIHHPRGDKFRQLDRLPDPFDMGKIKLAILHHSMDSSGANGEVSIWFLESGGAAPPSDILLGFLKYQTEVSYGNFRLSFDLPRVGSVVRCLGYSDIKATDGLNLTQIENNTVNLPDAWSHSFQEISGKVERIFLQGFAKKFIEGPCFTIDCDVPHGMSGGPVFNEKGDVCGIVSAGISKFTGQPGAIVSLLHPTLLTPLKTGAQLGPISIKNKKIILDYIAQGSIRTDGSEKELNFQEDNGQLVVGPRVHRDDLEHVFESIPEFEKGETAKPFRGKYLRIKDKN